MRGLEAWVSETHTTALVVLDGPLGTGTVVHEWYADSVTTESLLLGASMSKSALAHLVGRAITDGALRLDDTVAQHVPELAGSGYADCTVEQVLTMTTGTDWVEDHRNPTGPATRLVSCFTGAGGSSRPLLAETEAMDPPGTRWEYSTADSQVLDWVRERATGTSFAEAMTGLWGLLGCVRDAVVGVDADGVALAGGGLAACAEDWLRLAALQLTGTAYDLRVLEPEWVSRSSTPSQPWLAPGRLPSSITTHAGFGYHWWPLDPRGSRVTSDGSRGQFGYVDRDLGVAVLKTSLWPYDDWLVDRQQRDLSYLGLPLLAASAQDVR
jgi:CubicO group peptidase (beta-lactamase class C family)